MKTFWHRLAHLFGTNTGQVVSWWGDDDRLYIGFQCDWCGEVNGGHRSYQGITRRDGPFTPSEFRKANPQIDLNDPAQHASAAIAYGLSQRPPKFPSQEKP